MTRKKLLHSKDYMLYWKYIYIYWQEVHSENGEKIVFQIWGDGQLENSAGIDYEI